MTCTDNTRERMTLMLIPIYDQLLLPGMTIPLQIKHISKDKLQLMKASNESLIAITLKDKKSSPYENDDFYKIGVMLHINEISDKKDIEKFQELGCTGVQMATRFIGTYECDAHANLKNVLLNAKEDDIKL